MSDPSHPLAIENYLFAVFSVKKKPNKSFFGRMFGSDKSPKQDAFVSREEIPLAVFRNVRDAKLFRDARRLRETDKSVDYRLFQLDPYSAGVNYVDAGHM